MTLLKRLQEESRKSFKTRNPELFDLPNHSTNVVIDSRDSKCYLDDLDTLIATTVTAVLDEIEREVGRMRTVKENTHGTASNIKYVYLNDIKTIIRSKRTEI